MPLAQLTSRWSHATGGRHFRSHLPRLLPGVAWRTWVTASMWKAWSAVGAALVEAMPDGSSTGGFDRGGGLIRRWPRAGYAIATDALLG